MAVSISRRVMKDSQLILAQPCTLCKYIKESNERFSTWSACVAGMELSISRRVMKDSQPKDLHRAMEAKYIKESNERFSTAFMYF